MRQKYFQPLRVHDDLTVCRPRFLFQVQIRLPPLERDALRRRHLYAIFTWFHAHDDIEIQCINCGLVRTDGHNELKQVAVALPLVRALGKFVSGNIYPVRYLADIVIRPIILRWAIIWIEAVRQV